MTFLGQGKFFCNFNLINYNLLKVKIYKILNFTARRLQVDFSVFVLTTLSAISKTLQ